MPRMTLALFRRAPESDPPHLEVAHEGTIFKVVVKRRPAARRMTLRVSGTTGEIRRMTKPTPAAVLTSPAPMTCDETTCSAGEYCLLAGGCDACGLTDEDPGVRPQYRQFVAYAAPWEPIPNDGLPRHEERPAS